MNALYRPRSTFEFEHGTDCTVIFVRSHDTERVWKDIFAVTLNGYKVYFEMMRLKPRFPGQKLRNWGFGDITDPFSGKRLWNFNTFAEPLGFKGDMTTVRGDDDRTYVLCRNHAGVVEHRFLLAELLREWRSSIPTPKLVPVPPLPPQPLPATAIVSVLEPVPAPVSSPVRAPAPQVQPPVQARTRPALVPLADQSPEMRWFATEVLSRMAV